MDIENELDGDTYGFLWVNSRIQTSSNCKWTGHVFNIVERGEKTL